MRWFRYQKKAEQAPHTAQLFWMLQQRMLHFTSFACLCKRWTLFLWYSQTYSTHSILNSQKYVFSSWPSWKFKSLKSLHCHYQNFLFFQKPIFSKMIQLFGCIITFHQPPILEILCHFDKWAKKTIQNIITPKFLGKDFDPQKTLHQKAAPTLNPKALMCGSPHATAVLSRFCFVASTACLGAVVETWS